MVMGSDWPKGVTLAPASSSERRLTVWRLKSAVVRDQPSSAREVTAEAQRTQRNKKMEDGGWRMEKANRVMLSEAKHLGVRRPFAALRVTGTALCSIIHLLS